MLLQSHTTAEVAPLSSTWLSSLITISVVVAFVMSSGCVFVLQRTRWWWYVAQLMFGGLAASFAYGWHKRAPSAATISSSLLDVGLTAQQLGMSMCPRH